MERQKAIGEEGGEQNQENTTSGTKTLSELYPQGNCCNSFNILKSRISQFLLSELHEHQTKVRSRKIID